MSQLTHKSSISRFPVESVQSQIVNAVQQIPEEWESITRTELLYAGTLKLQMLPFLLEQDVHYCTTNEQDAYYRELLRMVRNNAEFFASKDVQPSSIVLTNNNIMRTLCYL